jgi:hypothetical protein
MRICKRILAGLTILISLVGLLLSIAGGIGVWIVKGPVTAKATRVFERVDAALDLGEQSLEQVKASLNRAAQGLESAREEQRELAEQPQPNQVMRRTLARTVQRSVAPEFDDAHEKLHTVAEAAIVVNTVLEDAGNIPLLSVAGLDTDYLTEMNGQLAEVSPAVLALSRLLGETDSSQMSRIERVLQRMQKLIADYYSQLTEVRQRTQTVKDQTLFWITPAAALISFVCFWIALSQVSLMSHAWTWWKHAGLQQSPAMPT